MDLNLRKAWKFFYDNGGYCTPPGRAQCALDLARAEQWAREEGLSFEWDDCQDTWDGDCPAPDMLLDCVCRDDEGNVLASLCCIGLNYVGRDGLIIHRGRLLQPYQRVVEAELAHEARQHAYDKMMETARQL